jgi:trimeric autotransporter adhesin
MSTWYRADAGTFTDLGTTAAANNQQVRQWNDQSGNSRHATQNTSGSRPVLRNNRANGIPGLLFTGNTFIDGPSLGISSTSGSS